MNDLVMTIGQNAPLNSPILDALHEEIDEVLRNSDHVTLRDLETISRLCVAGLEVARVLDPVAAFDKATTTNGPSVPVPVGMPMGVGSVFFDDCGYGVGGPSFKNPFGGFSDGMPDASFTIGFGHAMMASLRATSKP